MIAFGVWSVILSLSFFQGVVWHKLFGVLGVIPACIVGYALGGLITPIINLLAQ
jgi:hypothetical protein